MLRAIKFRKLMNSISKNSYKYYSTADHDEHFDFFENEKLQKKNINFKSHASAKLARTIIPIIKKNIVRLGGFEYSLFSAVIKELVHHPDIDEYNALFLLRSTEVCLDLFPNERQKLLENFWKALPMCNVVLSK